MNKLYIVRHGKTDWNELGKIQGWVDIPLNETGINDAKELSKSIDLDNIDVCISSPLSRAFNTAKILVDGKLEVIVNDLIKERNYGEREGEAFSEELVFKNWDYELNDNTMGVESVRDCLDRGRRFLEYIRDNYKDKNILVVTHGGFLKSLHFNLIGYNEHTDFLSFRPQNTTLYEYILEDETIKAGCFLVDKNTKKVAMVKRRIQEDITFPKGHKEDDESIMECAIRETEEEVKRKAIIIDDEPIVERYKTPSGEKCICYMYIAIDDGESDNDCIDTHDMMWVLIDEVENVLTHESLRSTWSRVKDKIISYID